MTMVNFIDLKKALILNGRFYKKHQLVVPTLKRLQMGTDAFVKTQPF